MKNKMVCGVVLTAVMMSGFFGNVAMASVSVSDENVELSRINSILNSVYPLLDAAQRDAEPNERIQFHYNWLREDIESIQAGIAQKINGAPIAPRMIRPLKTEFSGQS